MSSSLFAVTQFYLYGKRNFTQTGYQRHKAAANWDDILDRKQTEYDLTGKVVMVTGANSGVGYQCALYAARKGAQVYMICRNQGRAEAARQKIVDETKTDQNVHILQADLSESQSVRAMWDNFLQHRANDVRLDALVCNAGVLKNERTLTSEGVELTMACHLLAGVYLLGSLALPVMKKTAGSRIITTTSGGMLCSKFPSRWEDALTLTGKYNGNEVYSAAKRGQVILAEEWAKVHPEVKIVTAHPGWTLTPAVEAAYGDGAGWLAPMRSNWEAAEGIGWLMSCDADKIESGGFYLDRTPQVKHMSGAFFTEGNATRNSPEDVKHMMNMLEKWATGTDIPTPETLKAFPRITPLGSVVAHPAVILAGGKEAKEGQTWHVLAAKSNHFKAGKVQTATVQCSDPHSFTLRWGADGGSKKFELQPKGENLELLSSGLFFTSRDLLEVYSIGEDSLDHLILSFPYSQQVLLVSKHKETATEETLLKLWSDAVTRGHSKDDIRRLV